MDIIYMVALYSVQSSVHLANTEVGRMWLQFWTTRRWIRENDYS